MSFTVYGFRLRGEIEARYVGQTRFTPDDRFSSLLGIAKRMPCRTLFDHWLIDNADTIEAFPILTTETRHEARDLERRAIQTCLALGHRLFNQWLVPADVRISTNRPPLQDVAA